MGRRQDHHNQHDATMANSSSLALLQERFRQLEKVKERREGKELLKLFSSSSSDSSSSAVHLQASEQYSSSLQPSLLADPRIHGSLSLADNKQGHHNRTPLPSSNLWPLQGASASNFEPPDVDIDTSLHL